MQNFGFWRPWRRRVFELYLVVSITFAIKMIH